MTSLKVANEHVVRRRGEQPAVDSIEHAAVAGNQCRRVLHAGAAFEQRLEQIADDAERDDRSAENREQQRVAAQRKPGVRATIIAAVPKTNPPTAPSIVFLGLMAGASGRRPSARPV